MNNDEMVSVPRELLERAKQFTLDIQSPLALRKDLEAALARPAEQPQDQFRGDNKALVSSIAALLSLDAKGSLAPHGIGDHARTLLETSAARLADQTQGEPVARDFRKEFESLLDSLQLAGHEKEFNRAIGRYKYNHSAFELFQRLVRGADPGEVERLVAANTEYARRHLELGMGSMRVIGECNTLRAQLAKESASYAAEIERYRVALAGAHALLRWILATENISADETKRINAFLSASAEPEVKP